MTGSAKREPAQDEVGAPIVRGFADLGGYSPSLKHSFRGEHFFDGARPGWVGDVAQAPRGREDVVVVEIQRANSSASDLPCSGQDSA